LYPANHSENCRFRAFQLLCGIRSSAAVRNDHIDPVSKNLFHVVILLTYLPTRLCSLARL